MSLADSEEQMPDRQTGTRRRKVTKTRQAGTSAGLSPLEKAVEAHRDTVLTVGQSAVDVKSTFLFRLCCTVSHELGHCFGLDHCMYKACMMQGTASVAEDMRQPPYLCPVCKAKVAWAVTRRNTSGADSHSEGEHYTGAFTPLHAWSNTFLEAEQY